MSQWQPCFASASTGFPHFVEHSDVKKVENIVKSVSTMSKFQHFGLFQHFLHKITQHFFPTFTVFETLLHVFDLNIDFRFLCRKPSDFPRTVFKAYIFLVHSIDSVFIDGCLFDLFHAELAENDLGNCNGRVVVFHFDEFLKI